MNFVIITLDSLRYDTSQQAITPNLNHCGKWFKVGATGTYTLPAHFALFTDGRFPVGFDKNLPKYYQVNSFHYLFKVRMPWTGDYEVIYDLPNKSPNIVKGFEKKGYKVIGIGGVRWFDPKFNTSKIWKDKYFDEFYYDAEYRQNSPNGFLKQIKLIEKKINHNEPLFFFLNVASTHLPCRGNDSFQGQIEALEWVDSHINRVLSVLPNDTRVVIMGDHGTLFKEKDNGYFGHGFYHEKVMEIPLMEFFI